MTLLVCLVFHQTHKSAIDHSFFLVLSVFVFATIKIDNNLILNCLLICLNFKPLFHKSKTTSVLIVLSLIDWFLTYHCFIIICSLYKSHSYSAMKYTHTYLNLLLFTTIYTKHKLTPILIAYTIIYLYVLCTTNYYTSCKLQKPYPVIYYNYHCICLYSTCAKYILMPIMPTFSNGIVLFFYKKC